MDIKARLENQLRRTTLELEGQNYKNLFARLATLFGKPQLAITHTLKYRDDEGDWVDMSSDEELQIALSLARQQCFPLQLSLHESKVVEQPKQPETVQPTDPFQELNHHFQNLAEQWRPLIERVAAVATEHGFNPESIMEQLSSISIEREDHFLPLHSAWCDHCDSRIAGTRFKCLQCPDFDLCQKCIDTTRALHDSTHDFLHIEKPGPCPREPEQQEVQQPEPEAPVAPVEAPVPETPAAPVQEEDLPTHWALCDNCQSRIRGIRHKCIVCPDYDLCNTCVADRQTVHGEHQFVSIERPGCPWARAAPVAAPVVEQPQPVVVEEPQPVVVEQPQAPAEEPVNPLPTSLTAEKLQSALKQLEEMGFSDRENNIKAIIKNGGDIVTTIVDLLE